jgi:hypothetical protein
MNSTDARRQAEQLFSRRPASCTTTNEYEARSHEVRQKIEYLRQLRFAVQAQQISNLSATGTPRILNRGRPGRLNARAEN